MKSRRNVMPNPFTCMVADLFILIVVVAAAGFIFAAAMEFFHLMLEALA